MACQNASIQTQDSTRQAVGAGLRLDANEANRSKRLDECVKQIGDSMEGSYGGVHMEILENGFGTQLLVYTDNFLAQANGLKLGDTITFEAV